MNFFARCQVASRQKSKNPGIHRPKLDHRREQHLEAEARERSTLLLSGFNPNSRELQPQHQPDTSMVLLHGAVIPTFLKSNHFLPPKKTLSAPLSLLGQHHLLVRTISGLRRVAWLKQSNQKRRTSCPNSQHISFPGGFFCDLSNAVRPEERPGKVCSAPGSHRTQH